MSKPAMLSPAQRVRLLAFPEEERDLVRHYTLRLLNLIIYGPKSEKKPRTGQEQQLSLFDEAEQAAEEQKPQTFGEACTPANIPRLRPRRTVWRRLALKNLFPQSIHRLWRGFPGSRSHILLHGRRLPGKDSNYAFFGLTLPPGDLRRMLCLM